MENFENWNKKVRKKNLNGNSNSNENTNLNQRDYDKEPIIIKDYHQIFNSMLSSFSSFIAFMILLNIHIYVYGYLIPRPNDEIIKEIGNYIGIINAIAIFILLFYFFLSYYIFIIRRKAEIHFTNKFIQFYEFGKLQHNSSNPNLRDIICKTFWLEDLEKSDGVNIVVLSKIICCIMALVAFKIIGLLFIFFVFLANLFLKACFHLIIKRTLKDFTYFPAIIIDEPQRNGWVYRGSHLRGKFFMICNFDNKDYLEIKRWFLDIKNINIDNIEKKYFS